MLSPEHRLAVFMEGAFEDRTGKMGLGVLRYSSNPVVCMVDSGHAGEDAGALTAIPRPCPIVGSVDEAAKLGAEVMILGIAPPGGLLPKEWWPALDRSVELGLSLVNGLHERLEPRYQPLPEGQFVWDVRQEPAGIGVGTGAARLLPNKRVLTVGTDMSVGKMTCGLELRRAASARGLAAAFVATGQVGMVIAGSGVPLDAVRLDFASGAIEREVCRHASADLVVVEGQGSLLHPGSSATLPLLRGTCPTHLVLCHRAGMTHLARVPWVEVPPLTRLAGLYEELAAACGTFPGAKVVAVGLNTAELGDDDARRACAETEAETGLPTADPVRHGADRLLQAVLA